MSGRPVRRRVLADVARRGGWQAVLARIASGEAVTGIARSFGVSPGFFSRILHEDRSRHELVVELRSRAAGHEPRAETAGCSPPSPEQVEARQQSVAEVEG